MMKNVFILPEYWGNSHIGACGWIRLLNPLMHPVIQTSFQVQYGYTLTKAILPEIVIFERLWHPLDFDLNDIHRSLKDLKAKKVTIIYSLDDNLFDYTVYQKSDWFKSKHISLIHLFLHYADIVIVSTEALKLRISNFHPNIVVIRNVIQMDKTFYQEQQKSKKLKFGYLLSPDNSTYLYQIIEPLKEILYKYRKEVVFQINGHYTPNMTQKLFNDLPVEFYHPPNASYPYYIKWLERCREWDFALAPMIMNDFTACKSDMKFLDFTRLGIPGVYTDFTPYDAVKQQSAGYISRDNWSENIQQMIENPTERAEMLQNAEQYVSIERNTQVQVNEWLNVFNSIT